jgi:cytochrome c6
MRTPNERRSDVAKEAAFVLVMLALLAGAFFVGWIVGHSTRDESEAAATDTSGSSTTTATTATTTTGESTTTASETTTSTETKPVGGEVGNPTAGKEVFANAGCGSCHTLEDAGTKGNIGPNLDDAQPSVDKVEERVTNGQGAMPSFKDELTESEIKSVAAYVYAATHGS